MYTKTIVRQKLQTAVFKLLFDEEFNNEQITIPGGSLANTAALFDIGTVIGQIGVAGATVAAKAGITGGGALTLDGTAPVQANAIPGVYAVKCTVPAAVIGVHSGLFEVRDPKGVVLGEVRVGDTFSDRVKFSIAYATADFVVGDEFDITVAAGSGKYVQLNPAALDGSQNAAGVIFRGATVDSVNDTPAAAALRGPAVLLADGVVWPTGISATAQAAAVAQLAALGIIIRAS